MDRDGAKGAKGTRRAGSCRCARTSNIQHRTSNVQVGAGPGGGLRGGTGILPVSVYPRGRPVLRPKGTSASDLRVIGASQHTPSMSGGRRNENEWRYLRRLLATFMGGSRGSA